MPITVREFAGATGLEPFRVVSDLMELGIFAPLNQTLLESSVLHVAKKNGVLVEIVPPTHG